jgi:hypothetical protein
MDLILGVLGHRTRWAQKPRLFEVQLTVPKPRSYKGFVQAAERSFWVADVNVRGELELKAEYQYESLEQIPGAAELIGEFSGALWRSPKEFDQLLPLDGSRMTLRWQSTSPSTGMATLWQSEDLVSLSLLASGVDADADRITLEAFQHHLLTELRDTGIEPAFALLDLHERPLVATVNFQSPEGQVPQVAAALADRCFAASYFRYQQLV